MGTGPTVLVAASYLVMLWPLASAASRGGGFAVFAVGLLALLGALALARRGRRRPLFRLYFATLLATLAALGLEALLHVAPQVLAGPLANVSYTGYHWQRGGIYTLDPQLGPAMRPGARREMYWQGHWWRHEANADGYRGPALARADAVTLGDSMIYGHGVEAGETVAAQLASLAGVPVANLGQQGTSLLQSLMIFERKGLRLRPRVVFVCAHPTDVEETARYYAPEQLERFVGEPGYRPLVRPPWQPRPAWDLASLWARRVALPMRCAGLAGALVRGARAGTLVRRGAAAGAAPARFVPSQAVLAEPFAPAAAGADPAARLAWRAESRAVEEIRRLAAAQGARVVLLDLGYPAAFSQAVEALAGRLGLPYSPAGRTVLARAQAGEEMYLADDGHWTPLGCRAIAAELAGLLAP